MEDLYPITLTHSISDIHSGGFSEEEEKLFGFKNGEVALQFRELHELITLHKKNFGANLEKYKNQILQKNSEYKQIKTNLFVHESATIDSSVVFDASEGIIVIEKNARVMPFSYLVGPIRINENAIVHPHSFISNSYIGSFSKVGGEISDSVIENFSNKGHYGYIGDSYIGSWVNLGAGTSNSNLKNTYTKVFMNGIKTDEQFLGTIISDCVKTAINTSIYTGKIIGIASCIYGTVTSDVPSFTNYVSENNMFVYPLENAIKSAVAMQARRNIKTTESTKNDLSNAYNNTEQDRKSLGVKMEKLSFK